MSLTPVPLDPTISDAFEEITEVHSVDRKWSLDRAESALLVLVGGPERGRAIRLERSVTIGRGLEADILIRDPALSRVHARITREPNGYYVEDLGSRNGTFLESEPLAGRAVLSAGARLTLGRTQASFTLSGALEAEVVAGAHERARRDPLTNLHNRGVFDERLGAECAYAQRTGRTVGVLLIDLDHFKRINDEFGHQAGDAVLRIVGVTLQRLVRRYDLVARYGGEELAVVARDLTNANAAILGERIRSSIAALRIPWEGKIISVTASIGAAVSEAHANDTPDDLVAAADEALYMAKGQGRNRVVVDSE